MQEFEQNSRAFVSVIKKCSQVWKKTPHRVCLLVRVSASRALGPWLASWPGHTKDLHRLRLRFILFDPYIECTNN